MSPNAITNVQDQGSAPNQGDGLHHVQAGLELLLQQDQQGRGQGGGERQRLSVLLN